MEYDKYTGVSYSYDVRGRVDAGYLLLIKV